MKTAEVVDLANLAGSDVADEVQTDCLTGICFPEDEIVGLAGKIRGASDQADRVHLSRNHSL